MPVKVFVFMSYQNKCLAFLQPMAWFDGLQVQRALPSRYASEGVRVHVVPEQVPGLFTTDGMIWWIAGTESTALQVCQWRCACPTRSCSSTLSWTPSSTGLPRHRRRGGLGSAYNVCVRQNFVLSSKGVLWYGVGVGGCTDLVFEICANCHPSLKERLWNTAFVLCI